jgi:hypothetical protein
MTKEELEDLIFTTISRLIGEYWDAVEDYGTRLQRRKRFTDRLRYTGQKMQDIKDALDNLYDKIEEEEEDEVRRAE